MTVSEGDGNLLGRLCLLVVLFVFVIGAFGAGYNAGRHEGARGGSRDEGVSGLPREVSAKVPVRG